MKRPSWLRWPFGRRVAEKVVVEPEKPAPTVEERISTAEGQIQVLLRDP